ncbi:MAG: serine acetyltransferase [Ruminococcus sp.]|nr:serine acetyltransferase [Ruminococcus sp.]
MFRLLTSEYKTKYKNRKFALPFAIRCYYKMPTFRVEVLVKKAVAAKREATRKRLSKKLLLKYGFELGSECKIGSGLCIKHYNGIVIGLGTVIGNNCILYQQVTFGQKDEKYPTIGDNATFYPGAKIIGDIKIGNNAVIAANAVVINDVGDGEIVGGVPAKKIGDAKS